MPRTDSTKKSWLFIDTHAAGSYRWGWFADGKAQEIFERQGRAADWLEELSHLWLDRRQPPCQGICLVAGPGSFSAVRTGVLHANLLARLWRLPLIPVSVDRAANLDDLARALDQGSMPSMDYVAPCYDSEPNITLPVFHP